MAASLISWGESGFGGEVTRGAVSPVAPLGGTGSAWYPAELPGAQTAGNRFRGGFD